MLNICSKQTVGKVAAGMLMFPMPRMIGCVALPVGRLTRLLLSSQKGRAQEPYSLSSPGSASASSVPSNPSTMSGGSGR